MKRDLAANYLPIREGLLLSSGGKVGAQRPEAICGRTDLRVNQWAEENIMSGRRGCMSKQNAGPVMMANGQVRLTNFDQICSFN